VTLVRLWSNNGKLWETLFYPVRFVYVGGLRPHCYVWYNVSRLHAFALELIMASVFAVTGCVDSDVLDEFDFQSEYLEWEDIACMSEIQQDDDDDDVSIDIFPIFSE
jgi:hypothetical protein